MHEDWFRQGSTLNTQTWSTFRLQVQSLQLTGVHATQLSDTLLEHDTLQHSNPSTCYALRQRNPQQAYFHSCRLVLCSCKPVLPCPHPQPSPGQQQHTGRAPQAELGQRPSCSYLQHSRAFRGTQSRWKEHRHMALFGSALALRYDLVRNE